MKVWALLVAGGLLLSGCRAEPAADETRTDPVPRPPSTSASAAPVTRVMPDLIGLPAVEAAMRIGAVAQSSTWGRPMAVRCEQRPHTVTWQRPAPGTLVSDDVVVEVRFAAIDLAEFRGPCEPVDGGLGPVRGPDAALARQFYRFTANPSLGAPFVDGEVWIGIEDALFSTTISGEDIPRLAAWELRTAYAERLGPFSALDIVAGSGGYYELRRGVDNTCFTGDDQPPPGLQGLRALSLTVPGDIFSSCMDWWGVTLFLDSQDRIAGVALRLGSP